MELATAFITYPQAVRGVKTEIESIPCKWYAPTKHASWRYKTLYIKEPETIKWLNGLTSTDVFWDVGANIGVYTIYAALVKSCKTVAIEPGAANYWTLCKNIEINHLDNLVTGLCMALGDQHRSVDLFLMSTESGGAQNAVDRPVDDSGKTYIPKFKQGMLSIPADILISDLGVEQPTAIKIDVDGFELPVLRGAKKTLKSESLRRVSIELNNINSELVKEAVKILNESGLHSLGDYRSEHFAPQSTVRNFHFEKKA